jgi:hypothetical protein
MPLCYSNLRLTGSVTEDTRNLLFAGGVDAAKESRFLVALLLGMTILKEGRPSLHDFGRPKLGVVVFAGSATIAGLPVN